MGVMNITPNSFSDGGLYSSTNFAYKKFITLLKWADVIDIGAESTAPFNDPVDINEEFSRFEKYFFPIFKKLDDPKTTISIDTYRPELFYELYHVFKFYWPETNLIFNDVSGKIDADLINLLECDMKFDYIYSHNLCSTREKTSFHMNYCNEFTDNSFILSLVNYFNDAYKKIEKMGKKVWIDPCFGFSKTRLQNQYLLKNFKSFLNQLDANFPVVYGVSRKSFLRYPEDMDVKNYENQLLLDQMQAILVYDLIKFGFQNEFLFRVHNNSSIKSASNLMTILS